MNWLKLLIVFGTSQLAAQIPVLDFRQDTLLIIQDGKIQNLEKEVLFSTKGNIVFKGNSSSYKDILFTLALDSFDQKNEALIYNNKGAESNFSIKESVIYFKSGASRYPAATLVKNIDNLAIYNNFNDSLLAFIPNIQISKAEVFAVFYMLWRSNEMNSQLLTLIASNKNTQVDGLSVIEPVFGNGVIWIWDGKYLYPNGTNLNHSMVWVYEDNKLSPRNFPRTQEEWSWDGSGLKPYWGGNPKGQWTWQNGVLRQIWNNNYKNEFFIEDNIIRKRFGTYGDNEWEMKGAVPLPIITAIALGMLYR